MSDRQAKAYKKDFLQRMTKMVAALIFVLSLISAVLPPRCLASRGQRGGQGGPNHRLYLEISTFKSPTQVQDINGFAQLIAKSLKYQSALEGPGFNALASVPESDDRIELTHADLAGLMSGAARFFHHAESDGAILFRDMVWNPRQRALELRGYEDRDDGTGGRLMAREAIELQKARVEVLDEGGNHVFGQVRAFLRAIEAAQGNNDLVVDALQKIFGERSSGSAALDAPTGVVPVLAGASAPAVPLKPYAPAPRLGKRGSAVDEAGAAPSAAGRALGAIRARMQFLRSWMADGERIYLVIQSQSDSGLVDPSFDQGVVGLREYASRPIAAVAWLARQHPRAHVIMVTDTAIPQLQKDLVFDPATRRELFMARTPGGVPRVQFVSLDDPGIEFTTHKLINERGRNKGGVDKVAQIRGMIAHIRERAGRNIPGAIYPFISTKEETRAAQVIFDDPSAVYGYDENLTYWGSKSGGKKLLRAAAAEHYRRTGDWIRVVDGEEDIQNVDSLVRAISDIRARYWLESVVGRAVDFVAVHLGDRIIDRLEHAKAWWALEGSQAKPARLIVTAFAHYTLGLWDGMRNVVAAFAELAISKKTREAFEARFVGGPADLQYVWTKMDWGNSGDGNVRMKIDRWGAMSRPERRAFVEGTLKAKETGLTTKYSFYDLFMGKGIDAPMKIIVEANIDGLGAGVVYPDGFTYTSPGGQVEVLPDGSVVDPIVHNQILVNGNEYRGASSPTDSETGRRLRAFLMTTAETLKSLPPPGVSATQGESYFVGRFGLDWVVIPRIGLKGKVEWTVTAIENNQRVIGAFTPLTAALGLTGGHIDAEGRMRYPQGHPFAGQEIHYKYTDQHREGLLGWPADHFLKFMARPENRDVMTDGTQGLVILMPNVVTAGGHLKYVIYGPNDDVIAAKERRLSEILDQAERSRTGRR